MVVMQRIDAHIGRYCMENNRACQVKAQEPESFERECRE